MFSTRRLKQRIVPTLCESLSGFLGCQNQWGLFLAGVVDLQAALGLVWAVNFVQRLLVQSSSSIQPWLPLLNLNLSPKSINCFLEERVLSQISTTSSILSSFSLSQLLFKRARGSWMARKPRFSSASQQFWQVFLVFTCYLRFLLWLSARSLFSKRLWFCLFDFLYLPLRRVCWACSYLPAPRAGIWRRSGSRRTCWQTFLGETFEVQHRSSHFTWYRLVHAFCDQDLLRS